MLLSVDSPYESVQFDLVADAEPGVLARLLVPFARRDLLPDLVKSRRQGECLEATLAMNAMPSGMVHLVEGNLRQIVGVRALTVVFRRRTQQAA
jgi:hypothetical protein